MKSAQSPSSQSNFSNLFVIAEISSNHGGSLENAKKLIEQASEAGCQAVKLQTYKPEIMTINSRDSDFMIKKGTWQGMTMFDLYKEAQTPYAWHKELFELCKKLDLICFSSAFDIEAADLLASLDCPIYKIASFELTDLALIRHIAKKKKPMIMSCGMASLDEIALAYFTALTHGATSVVLLHCISSYPAKVSDMNISNIVGLQDLFLCQVGLSDHTLSNQPATAAYALGSRVFEKHIKLGGGVISHDETFSLDGEEFKSYVESLKLNQKMMGENISKSKLKKHKIKQQTINEIKKFYLSYKNDNFSKEFTPSQSELGQSELDRELLKELKITEIYTIFQEYKEALLNNNLTPIDKEKNKENIHFRRSVFATQDIEKGEELTKNNTKTLRPSLGISSKYYPIVIGKKAKLFIKKGKSISWEKVNK